jgi:hypothetical protein
MCNGAGPTLCLQDVHLNMYGESPMFGGINLDGCSLVDCSVSNVGNVGVWADGLGESPTFQSVDVFGCPAGLVAEDVHVYWQGGRIYNCSNTGMHVVSYDWSTSVTLSGDAYFWNCGTAFSTSAFDFRSVWVGASGCRFANSDYGMVLEKAKGYVKSCRFEDIYATGITVEYYRDQLDIGRPNEGNTFYRVDGTGVELGSGARVAIVENEFDRVLGTGILCNTGAADTIRACELDGYYEVGSEYCYEGIHTEGDGTMVRIRDNPQISEYTVGPFPTPRAVYVRGYASGATADLGRNLPLGEWGNNVLINTGIDVYYTGIVAQGQPIPYLYAQRNYWGGTDPWLAGTWKDYIIWEPDLDNPPGAPPAWENLSSAPEAVALGNVSPNPAVCTAGLSCTLPAEGAVELTLWDIGGHRVKTLIQENLPAGTATVEWDGTDEVGNPVASGAYLCRLKSSHGQATRRFVFMR